MIRKRRLFVSTAAVFTSKAGELGQHLLTAASPVTADTDNMDYCVLILDVNYLHLNQDIL